MTFFIIIFFGLFLRLINLNQSLWLDEATTALVSKMSFSQMFASFLPGDFHPPAYYIVLNLWSKIFGYSEISLRLPSVIFGLATIVVVYHICKKIFDTNTANMASILTATSGLLIYYSQEARMYNMIVFLVSFMFYAFVSRKWFVFSVLLALVGITDYVALLVLPVFWITFILNKKRQDLPKFVQSHILLAFLSLAWAQTFIKQLTGGLNVVNSPWGALLGPSNLKNILLIPTKFILGRISFDDKFYYTLVVSFSFAIVGYLLFCARKANKLIWMWLVLPILFGIIISFKIPTLSYFRFIYCLPALYIIIAKSLTSVGRQFRYLFAIMALINIGTSSYYLVNQKFHREDWRGMVGFVESNRSNDSRVVFVTRSNWEAYMYYAPNAKIDDSGILSEKPTKELWLVRYVWEIFDPKDSTRVSVEKLGYNRKAEYNFNGVVVFKYLLN